MEAALGEFDWTVVALFGTAVALAELASRYRDAPEKALLTPAASLYVALNLVAGVAALALLRGFGWTFGQPGSAAAWTQIVVAALGSMAVLRSSLFTVRVGDQDISIGPNGFLQVVLDAADRSVDRARAQARAAEVAKLMVGVSFAQAAVSLPAMCGALRQDLSNAEQQVLQRQVNALTDSPLPEEAKVIVLGLALMDAVGRDVLRSAIQSLGRQIRAGAAAAAYVQPAVPPLPAASAGAAGPAPLSSSRSA
jgi:hypothetical protein